MVDGRGVVGGQAERDPGDRRHRAREADQRVRLVQRHPFGGQVERRVDVRGDGADLRGRGRVGDAAVAEQVTFRQPHAADVHAAGGTYVLLPEHELGGAAADVEHQVGRRRPVPPDQLPGGARKGQLGLLVAGDHLGNDAEDVLHPAGEVLPVLRVPGRGGRREPHAVRRDAVPRDGRGVLAAGGERPLQRLGGQAARPVHALAEADDLHAPVEVGQPSARRVGVRDQQPDGVGAAVDGGGGRHAPAPWSPRPRPRRIARRTPVSRRSPCATTRAVRPAPRRPAG